MTPRATDEGDHRRQSDIIYLIVKLRGRIADDAIQGTTLEGIDLKIDPLETRSITDLSKIAVLVRSRAEELGVFHARDAEDFRRLIPPPGEPDGRAATPDDQASDDSVGGFVVSAGDPNSSGGDRGQETAKERAFRIHREALARGERLGPGWELDEDGQLTVQLRLDR